MTTLEVATASPSRPVSSAAVAPARALVRANAESRSGPAAYVAGALALASVGIVAVSIVVWAGRDFAPLPVSFGQGVIGAIGLVAASVAYGTFGAVLAARLPRNPIGWIFLTSGVLLATMLPVNVLVLAEHETLRPASTGVVAAAWLRTTVGTPGVATLLLVGAYLFPDGRPLPGRWRIGLVLAVLGGTILGATAAADPNGLVTYPSLPNPTAAPMALAPAIAVFRLIAVLLLVLAMMLALGSIHARYRTSDPPHRAQLRWILFATGVAAASAVPFLGTRYLIDVSEGTGEFASLAVQLGICAFPIGAAIAIVHYRLYDVDLLIGRTLVYLPLTAILGGLYTASIAMFQRLFVMVSGETSDLAIVLTVLLVASVFTPLRRSLEGALERHFVAVPRDAVVADRGDQAGVAATVPTIQDGVDDEASSPTSRASGAPSVPIGSLLPIDDGGCVACPLRGSPTALVTCIACPRFRAIVTDPGPGVVCVVSRPGPADGRVSAGGARRRPIHKRRVANGSLDSRAIA